MLSSSSVWCQIAKVFSMQKPLQISILFHTNHKKDDIFLLKLTWFRVLSAIVSIEKKSIQRISVETRVFTTIKPDLYVKCNLIID